MRAPNCLHAPDPLHPKSLPLLPRPTLPPSTRTAPPRSQSRSPPLPAPRAPPTPPPCSAASAIASTRHRRSASPLAAETTTRPTSTSPASAPSRAALSRSRRCWPSSCSLLVREPIRAESPERAPPATTPQPGNRESPWTPDVQSRLPASPASRLSLIDRHGGCRLSRLDPSAAGSTAEQPRSAAHTSARSSAASVAGRILTKQGFFLQK